MIKFLTLRPEAFGLDISDLSLKVAKLKKRGKFLNLASFGETKMKPGIIEQGEIKDEKALAENIIKAVKEVQGERIKTKYVVVSLPEEKAFLQVIKMPLMKEEEVKKAVYFEAENYIPLPIDNVYLDCQIIPSASAKSKHLDVLIAALPKKSIDPYLSSLKQAGLKPLALEIESQAVSRALVEQANCSKPVLLVDLGASRTSFIIFSDCSLKFTSSSSISSKRFTEAIAKNLKITLSEAETLKMKEGILSEQNSQKKTVAGEDAIIDLKKIQTAKKVKTGQDGKQILQILAPDLTELAQQIKKYLNYYQDHYNQKIQKILLCGGGVNLKGLSDFMHSQTGLPVEMGNPWVNILPKRLKEVPKMPYPESLRYTTALGLALRGMKT